MQEYQKQKGKTWCKRYNISLTPHIQSCVIDLTRFAYIR